MSVVVYGRSALRRLLAAPGTPPAVDGRPAEVGTAMTRLENSEDARERERWRIVYSRCDGGRCCPASEYHTPRCARRAEHQARKRLRRLRRRATQQAMRQAPAWGRRCGWVVLAAVGLFGIVLGIIVALVVGWDAP